MYSLMISAVCLLSATFFYINKPVVDMRESPTHESKVVSQAIFSEEVSIEKKSDDWSSIITPDGYSGWIESDALVNLKTPYPTQLVTSRLAAHIYGVKDTEYGPIKTVPYGSKLQALDSSDLRWIKIGLPDGQKGYIQKGDVAIEPKLLYKHELAQFSQKFLSLPYTWGGRSSFGYDCSGFVQMLYSKIGINLPRDSKQQILDDRLQVIPIEELEPGDLIFFGKSEQKITHVGVYIGGGQFIHSTVSETKPWIRISNLSDFEWSGNAKANYPFRSARRLIDR